MEYRIETKEAFRIVGVSAPLEKEIEKNFDTVPAMWGKAATDGTVPRLAQMMDSEPKGILGVSACMGEDQWAYYISAASTQPVPEGMTEYMVLHVPGPFFQAAGPCPTEYRSWKREWSANGCPVPAMNMPTLPISRCIWSPIR